MEIVCSASKQHAEGLVSMRPRIPKKRAGHKLSARPADEFSCRNLEYSLWRIKAGQVLQISIATEFTD